MQPKYFRWLEEEMGYKTGIQRAKINQIKVGVFFF